MPLRNGICVNWMPSTRLPHASAVAQKFAKQVGDFHIVMPAPAGIQGWRGDNNEDGYQLSPV